MLGQRAMPTAATASAPLQDGNRGEPSTRSGRRVEPPALWGLDPLYWTFAKLTLGAILHATSIVPPYAGQFWLGDRPLKTVHVVATIVSVDVRASRVSFCLDDGTGLVEAVYWRKPTPLSATHSSNVKGFLSDSEHALEEGLENIRLGDTVRCQGKLQARTVDFSRTPVEISVYSIVPVEDPNEEALHSLQCEQLWCSEYSQHNMTAHFSKPTIESILHQQTRSRELALPAAEFDSTESRLRALLREELREPLTVKIAEWIEHESLCGAAATSNVPVNQNAQAPSLPGTTNPHAESVSFSDLQAVPTLRKAALATITSSRSNSAVPEESLSSRRRTESPLRGGNNSTEATINCASPAGDRSPPNLDSLGATTSRSGSSSRSRSCPPQLEFQTFSDAERAALVTARFRKALHELLQKGYAALCNEATDEYSLLSISRVLQHRILGFLQKRSQHSHGEQEGLSCATFPQILEHLHSRRDTLRVSSPRVRLCLTMLVEKSLIFEVHNGLFAVV